MRCLACRFLWVACLLFSLIGCNRSAGPTTPAKIKTYVIGVCLTRIDEPWRAQLKTDLEAAAAKRGNLRLVFRTAESDAAKQQGQLAELCNAGVDLIVIRPVSAQELTEPIAKIFNAGMPVIVLDRALVGDKYTSFISADYKQIGRTAGKWLSKQLQGKGKIVELQGPVDSLPDQELNDGFRLETAGSRLSIRFRWPRRSAENRCGQIDGRGIEKKVENIDAVFAYDDAAALAAYQTAKAAGRQKDIRFIGRRRFAQGRRRLCFGRHAGGDASAANRWERGD